MQVFEGIKKLIFGVGVGILSFDGVLDVGGEILYLAT